VLTILKKKKVISVEKIKSKMGPYFIRLLAHILHAHVGQKRNIYRILLGRE
jgi:hypothetical protein